MNTSPPPFFFTNETLMHLQHTAFENIVAKGEIAHDESFLLFPQFVQLYSLNKPTFIAIVHYSCLDGDNIVCCRFVVCGKGLMAEINSPIIRELVT